MQQKPLKHKAKDTTSNTTKLFNTTTVAKLSDVIKVHLSQFFGSRSCDMFYLIFRLVAIPKVAPSLEMNKPHSAETGSIQREMSMRIYHSHPLYHNDNNTFYSILEEAICVTLYEASIKPFHHGLLGMV